MKAASRLHICGCGSPGSQQLRPPAACTATHQSVCEAQDKWLSLQHPFSCLTTLRRRMTAYQPDRLCATHAFLSASSTIEKSQKCSPCMCIHAHPIPQTAALCRRPGPLLSKRCPGMVNLRNHSTRKTPVCLAPPEQAALDTHCAGLLSTSFLVASSIHVMNACNAGHLIRLCLADGAPYFGESSFTLSFKIEQTCTRHLKSQATIAQRKLWQIA